MKSITFDQLKTMLKSMSNTIFKRIGVLEDKVSPPNKPIKHIYATDENGNAKWTKSTEVIGQIDPIIITAVKDENGKKYTCNFTAGELWDVDVNIIQQNTRVIDGDNQYAVRGVRKIAEPLYGKIIQFTAEYDCPYYDLYLPNPMSIIFSLIDIAGKRLHVMDTQGLTKEIDMIAPFQRKDLAFFLRNRGSGWASECLAGVKDAGTRSEVSVVLNVVSTDYKSVINNYNREENPIYHIDIDRVSVVQAVKDGSLSGVVLYYTDSHEAAVGKTAVLDHIETTDITHTSADVAFIMQPDENGKYARITLNSDELKTANVEWLQTDTIGNKKVGDGLEVVDGKLNAFYRKVKLINSFTVTEDVDRLTIDKDADGNPFELKVAIMRIQCGMDVAEGEATGSIMFSTPTENYFARIHLNRWKYPGYKVTDTYTRPSTAAALCDVSRDFTFIDCVHGDEGGAVSERYIFSVESLRYAPDTVIVRASTSFKVPKNAKVWLYGVRKIRRIGV